MANWSPIRIKLWHFLYYYYGVLLLISNCTTYTAYNNSVVTYTTYKNVLLTDTNTYTTTITYNTIHIDVLTLLPVTILIQCSRQHKQHSITHMVTATWRVISPMTTMWRPFKLWWNGLKFRWEICIYDLPYRALNASYFIIFQENTCLKLYRQNQM